MIKYHTDGAVCARHPVCTRWHTTTTPVVHEDQWYWPTGTSWATAIGTTEVSPTREMTLAPAYEPPASGMPKATAETPRGSALMEARNLINGDRNNQYGPPTQDFARTADLLNALGYRRVDAVDKVHSIVPSDVAIIIAQVKMSRLMHSRGKRDNWVDLAGYAGCGYECAVEEEKTDD